MNNINFKAVLKALLFSVTATVAALLLLGVICYFSNFSDKTLSVIVFIVTVLCLLFGGIFAAKGAESGGFLHGALVGIGYVVLLLICSIIENKGFHFSMHLLSMGIGCIGAAILGGVLGINGKKQQY